MGRRLTKVAVLVVLAALLASLPGLAACGEDKDKGKTEITVGWLWDLTGRAASAVIQMYEGFRDYITVAEREDPIEGVEIKFITYDTRSDASRVTPGYVWLKGKGITLISSAPHDAEALMSDFEADEIPYFGVSSVLGGLKSEWFFHVYGPPESQVEVEMHWIMDTWEGTEKPKVGFAGLAGIPYYEGQRDMVIEVASAYPDDFEWLGAQMAPTTTTSWVAEIDKLEDADFIFVGMSGPPLATFVSEARARGYANNFIGPMESFWAFWELVMGRTPQEELHGCISVNYEPWWDDDVPFIAEIKAHNEEFLSPAEIESNLISTGRISGWAGGTLLYDVVKRAVDKVGAENVDSLALKEALAETDREMISQGFGNDWKLTNVNCFAYTLRIYEYQPATDTWDAISDVWYTPPTLAG